MLHRFIPALSASGVDIASSLANVVGVGVAGALVAVEKVQPTESISLLSVQIRGNFIGVWCSFPFIAVHAAEVAGLHGLPAGLLYVAACFTTAGVIFELFRQTTTQILRRQHQKWALVVTRTTRFRLVVALGLFVASAVLRNSWTVQTMLFSDVPLDAAFAVDDGFLLLIRMIFAVAGNWTSGWLGGPPSRSNVASCVLVGMAYTCTRWVSLGPNQLLAIEIFVGTFCGCLSSFPEVFSEMMLMKRGKEFKLRLSGEVAINLAAAAMFGLAFYGANQKGWEIDAAQFFERRT